MSRDASLVDLILLWACIVAAVAVQEYWGPLWGAAVLVPGAVLVLLNPKFWRE